MKLPCLIRVLILLGSTGTGPVRRFVTLPQHLAGYVYTRIILASSTSNRACIYKYSPCFFYCKCAPGHNIFPNKIIFPFLSCTYVMHLELPKSIILPMISLLFYSPSCTHKPTSDPGYLSFPSCMHTIEIQASNVICRSLETCSLFN
jgi:hypothetical protein